MSVQQTKLSADFSDCSFERFCMEFFIFLHRSFPDLSQIKATVKSFEHSLSRPYISDKKFVTFFDSLAQSFNLKVTLPKLPFFVNFLNFSLLI